MRILPILAPAAMVLIFALCAPGGCVFDGGAADRLTQSQLDQTRALIVQERDRQSSALTAASPGSDQAAQAQRALDQIGLVQGKLDAIDAAMKAAREATPAVPPAAAGAAALAPFPWNLAILVGTNAAAALATALAKQRAVNTARSDASSLADMLTHVSSNVANATKVVSAESSTILTDGAREAYNAAMWRRSTPTAGV